MEEKVLRFIKDNALFAPGDTVVVALSGGADSMALFHFLCTRQRQMDLTLLCAHLNHGLRGAEADRDEEFVRQACQKAEVPLCVEKAYMADRESPPGMGTEAFARQLRYTFLEKLAEQHYAKIATAHTFSDNVETVLFHAVRGAGPRGLAGILPVRGRIVRPLLVATRADVEAYCRKHNISYITDSTNLQVDFTRNRLRLQVLPLLEDIHPGAAQALGRMAGDMRELDNWLTALAEELLSTAFDGEGYAAPVLLAAPQPVLLQAFSVLAGPDANRATLTRMGKVLQGELGAAMLPGERTARLEKGRFFVLSKPDIPQTILEEFPVEEKTYSFGGRFIFGVRISPKTEKTAFYSQTGEKGLTFWADYDKIAEVAMFRTRRTGDVFDLPGRGIHKSIKKWMNEQQIPRSERELFPLLCEGPEVLWAYGVGFCSRVKVDDTTETVFTIEQKQ